MGFWVSVRFHLALISFQLFRFVSENGVLGFSSISSLLCFLGFQSVSIRKRNVSIEERLSQIPEEEVRIMREEVIRLIPRLVYADPRPKLETLKDAFDVSVQAVIDKVTNLRKDIIEGRTDENFIEENSWKHEGQREVGPHEWDPFFSKPKDGSGESSASSAEVAKNSWKNEQRNQS